MFHAEETLRILIGPAEIIFSSLMDMLVPAQYAVLIEMGFHPAMKSRFQRNRRQAPCLSKLRNHAGIEYVLRLIGVGTLSLVMELHWQQK